MSDESTVVSPDSEEREPEAHDAGATRSSAHDLGDVTDAGKVQNHEAQVGADGDAVDYYRFTLTQAREMRLGLWHREGDAELFLEDAEGTVLGRSVVYGHGKEAMVRTLGPGTYYVRIEAQGPEASAHQLKVLAMEPYEVYTFKGAVFAKLLGLPSFGEWRHEWSLSENADGSGEPVSLGTVAATDPDGDVLRYSLVGGNESGLFTIDATSGEVFYIGAGVDYESGAGPYELTVRASDGTHTIDATVTVTVADIPEAPVFTESSYEFELAENAVGNETRISLGTVSATDPDRATVGYSLVSGHESGRFAIDEVSGEVFYAGSGEDHESVPSHELTVRASDGTSTTDTTVTVTVTDVPEAPEFAQASYEFILAENADGSGTPVSLGTVAATDPDRGDTLRYTLVGGNDSGRFTVDASSGEVFYAGSGEDFESGAGPFELTVRASDETSSTDTTVTVTVTDVPEAPEFAQSSYEFTLAENTDGSGTPISLGTVAAADPEGATVGYSLVGGNESGRFAIDTSSGEVFYAGPGEDFESVPSHELTVRASDGTRTKDMPVTVTVTDIRGDSEAPGADLPPDTTTPAVVLVDEGAVRGNIESTTDWDWFAVDLQGGHTYRVDHRGRSTGDGTLVDPVLMGVYEYSSGRRLLSGTATSDGGTGHNAAVEFVAPHDGRYYIWVSGNGYEGIGTGTYELEVSTVPVPVFGEARYGFTVAENADGSETPISLGTVTATDPDGGTLRYSLVGGNDSGRFTIDASNGELHYAGPGEDYESEVTSHRLTVRASDGEHFTDTTVAVTVTDESEAPAFEETSYAFVLAENADGSETRVLLGAVQAADPDVGDTLRYSLVGGNDSGTFEIDASSGELFYVGAGEHDANGARAYGLTVRASDGTHDVDTTVTVTLVIAQPAPVSEKSADPQGTSEPVGEDLPAARSTSGEVLVDAEPVEGTLRSPSDRDWFAVTLAPGRTYVFDLDGDGPSGGPVPVIRGLRDSNGSPVPGIVRGNEVRYTTDADAPEGAYYVEIGGSDDPGQGTSTPRGLGTRSIGIVPLGGTDGGSSYRLRARDISETKDVTDDYPADTTTTGTVVVGGRTRGELERPGDRDWFAVTLEAGKTYWIGLEGSPTAAGTLYDPSLRGVYDDNGNLISDDTRHNENGMFFHPQTNGSYYIAAGAYQGRFTGTYRLSVTEAGADDHPAGPSTTVTVAVGGMATGEIEHVGDQDWFAVTLEADKFYRIALEGARSNAGTLWSPDLRGIHDAQGNLIRHNVDYSAGLAYFGPETPGTYYIAADAFRGTGTYRVSVTELTDDYTAGTDTAGTVAVGGQTRGELEHPSDRDWFAVTLEAGKSYRIDLRVSDRRPGDTQIYGVHDAHGNLISGTDNRYGVDGRKSPIFFEPENSGTHYIPVGTWGDSYWNTGTYTLAVTWISNHYISGFPDDYTSDTNTSGTIEVGSWVRGEREWVGDNGDWFAVELEAGKTYWFDVMGRLAGGGTAWVPLIGDLYDADGEPVDSASDTFIFPGLVHRLTFTAPGTDSTYYIAATAMSPGSYTLRVTDSAVGLPADLAADTDTSGTVTVGGSTNGTIDTYRDRDWFAVTLESGKTYSIDLKGASTGDGTLLDPFLRGIHDANGNLLEGTTNDDGGTGLNSQVRFTANADATYYVAAGDSGSLIGTYTLAVEEVTDAM